MWESLLCGLKVGLQVGVILIGAFMMIAVVVVIIVIVIFGVVIFGSMFGSSSNQSHLERHARRLHDTHRYGGER